MAAIVTKTATNWVPALAPCSTRPTRSWASVPAVPATTSPAANSSGVTSSAGRGPATSHQRPPSTVPSTDAARNAENGQP